MLTREQALSMASKEFHFMPPDARGCSGVVARRIGKTKTRAHNVVAWRIPVSLESSTAPYFITAYFITESTADFWHLPNECPNAKEAIGANEG